MSKVCSIDLLSVGELLALLDFPLANRKLLLRLDKKPPRCHLLGSCSCTSVISFTSQAMTHNPAHHNSKVCQKAGIKHTLRTFNIVLSPSRVKQSTDKPCYWSIGTCDFLLLEIRNSKYFNKWLIKENLIPPAVRKLGPRAGATTQLHRYSHSHCWPRPFTLFQKLCFRAR